MADRPNHLEPYAGTGYAFETDNPVINFLRRMNRGELGVQQAAGDWLAEHPIAREFAQRAATQLPLAVRSSPGVATANQGVALGRRARGRDNPFQNEGTITGGMPEGIPPSEMDLQIGLTQPRGYFVHPPAAESSVGMTMRYPQAFRDPITGRSQFPENNLALERLRQRRELVDNPAGAMTRDLMSQPRRPPTPYDAAARIQRLRREMTEIPGGRRDPRRLRPENDN